jgi:predicted HicB family RNase H-like nuclease
VKLVYNEELPPEIRRALTREAKRRDVKINDVAGEALARHYGMEWEISGAPYRASTAATDKIRVPEKLHRKIRQEALRVSGGTGTMRGVVLSILAESLELSIVVSKIRKPRKEPA